MKYLHILVLTASLLWMIPSNVGAQSIFDKPLIKKVDHENRESFQNRVESVKWTGVGLYNRANIDYIPTMELRARLQAVFGEPTQTLKDLIYNEDFRPGNCIQFEYWFVVNDSIPMMVLDVDGPFDNGFVYAGASRYIDLMPEVKRTFSEMLMEIENLGEYTDYFYSPEISREAWYIVSYQNGEFQQKKLEIHPKGFKKIEFDLK